MRTSRWIWAVWALVAIAFGLPYGPLRDVHAWYGSFLVWTLIGIAVVAVNVLITRDFSDDHRIDE